jgi:hypothetical protein
MKPKHDELPFAGTEAAMLLAGAIGDRARDKVSIRELGRRLEYKQAVVLSHMAAGRVPIPIDRALDIARVVGLDPRRFLFSVLQQRHPGIDWSGLMDADAGFASELELIAGRSLDELAAETKSVLREVVVDPNPGRRWLTTAELPTVEIIRNLRPAFPVEGLDAEEKRELRKSLGI